MKLVRIILIAAMALLLLCGCTVEQLEPTTAPTEPPVTETTAPTQPPLPTVTVRFWAMGRVIAEQQVVEGQYPDMAAVDLSGLVFSGWTDREGNGAMPELTVAYEDASYYAQAYPAFTNHMPYLFADDNGDIRAEETLTADELAAALQALASEQAVPYLLLMPRGSAGESVGAVREVLNDYFPLSTIREIFDGLDDVPMSRGTFAHIMNRLLDRGGEESVALSRTMTIPGGLGTDSQNFFDILEAAVPHAREEAGAGWSAALLDMSWEPGFFNIDGGLYYADEDGVLARDTVVNGLTFGPDGRFTSGDEELDEIVRGILRQIIADNPGLERLDILRKAFEYSRDSFDYLRKPSHAFGATGWEIEDAKTMFTTGRGNCFNFAATFWAMARGLGYNARAISGTMTVTYQSHSWVEIEIDGTNYIFDPEEEYVYLYQRGYEPGAAGYYDMFMVTMAAGERWTYRRP